MLAFLAFSPFPIF